MEGFIVMLLIAILALPIVLLIWVKTSTGSLIREVLQKLNSLSKKVDHLQQVKIENPLEDEDEKVVINESLLKLMGGVPRKTEKLKVEKEKVKEIKLPVIKQEVEEVEKPILATKEKLVEIIKQEKVKVEEKPKPVQKAAIIAPPKKKRNWEQFIGENLINKVGIGILVLGIAYFVNFAIENDWIGEIGRVAVGVLSGGLLILFAHRIRKAYKAFSSVLVGGAMAVFYYTIAIAFHEYHLFSQTVSFALMVLITMFSVLLSISYDKKELAILGLIGAFSTPLMLSNGGGNYQILFSYIAIVNVGMLVLAYFKKWNVVNILSFAFTVLLYVAWFGANVIDVENPPYQGAFFFAALFYVLFFFMHIINNVKESRKFKGYEFGLMLSTTAMFYGAGMAILHLSGNDNMRGLFTVALGVFNLLFAFPLFRKNTVDKSLIYLLVGMVLTFVSLAAPVQLSGNYITLFWATEMVLLLWLAQKSGIQFVKWSSLIIFGLTVISLLMDWQQIYFTYGADQLGVILNKGVITTLFTVLGVVAYLRLLKNESNTSFLPGVNLMFVNNALKITAFAMLYLIGVIEITYQINSRLSYEPLANLAAIAYSYLMLLLAVTYANKKQQAKLIDVGLFVSAIALLTFPFFNEVVKTIRADYLFGEIEVGAFLMQYLNLILISGVGLVFLKGVKKRDGLRSDIGKATVLGLSLLGVIVLSMQLNHHALLFAFDHVVNNASLINKQVLKIGYPIVWGVSSFVMMLIGMKYKYRTLRFASLGLFGIILLKLFLFDIRGASEAGKIIAFVLLGVLLLVISFLYQKLKNLMLDKTE